MNKNKIEIAGLIIITVFAIISDSLKQEFQISKVEVDSNTVVNINPEELSK